MPAERLSRALCSRADLLRMLAAGLSPEAAQFVGYRHQPRRLMRKLIEPLSPTQVDVSRLEIYAPPLASTAPEPLFWRVIALESTVDAVAKRREAEENELSHAAEPYEAVTAPTFEPLGTFAQIVPGLRRFVAVPRETRDLDVPVVLRRIGRGEVVETAPRARRRRWGGALHVVSDRSDHLIPYHRDYEILLENLRRLFPEGMVTDKIWQGGQHDPIPAAGNVVLAFSDLGSLWTGGDGAQKAWATFGKTLRKAGCHPVAVLPGTPLRSLDSVSRIWGILGWRPVLPPLPEGDRRAALDRLLTLAAPALRVEPGLLRKLRLLVGAGADPGLEAEFWQSSALTSRHVDAATLQAGERQSLLARFACLPREDRRKALVAGLLEWRPIDSRYVCGVEIKSLDEDSQSLVPEALHRQIARDFTELSKALRQRDNTAARGWSRVALRAITPEAWRVIERYPAAQRALLELWSVSNPDSREPPPGFDPAILDPSRQEPRELMLRQRGARITAEEASAIFETGSALATILSRGDELSVEPVDDFWKLGAAPPFAERWGCDKTGPWLEFSLQGAEDHVVQRMRWINPGRFLMGSPVDEAGRDDDEGPQHEVTISRGYWLFDTACTQALWTAVMGSNPSNFKGADRPVEGVSWHDACAFVARLNEKIPELALTLPSEAQWEYACRAGKTTPFSFGENITPEQVNYDGEDPYRDAPAGLYRKETVPVASLPANGWGLYEMHGNVWEWCADAWHINYEGAPSDGSVWDEEDATERVLRGGSWFSFARYVRSAYRYRDAPDVRNVSFGFRCARVQDGAEPAETRRVRQAERRTAAAPSGVAERARVFVGGEGAAIFPRAGPFVIRSDCERVTLEPLTLPPWAKAIGRDRFGLWTRIEVTDTSGSASQKLRWINPGRFLMGSPVDEAGRDDDEGPQHEVTISRGYWLFDTACTQALWTAVMGSNPSNFKGADRPVEGVSWHDACAFVARLNEKIPELALTLPSEAQWEYACRAGKTTPFSFGENITPEQVNYDGEDLYRDAPAGLYRKETVPVASLPANDWGLYEMHGNVWEWCADAWHDSYEGAPSNGAAWQDLLQQARRVGPPAEPSSGVIGVAKRLLGSVQRSGKKKKNLSNEEEAAERVLRGGSWYGNAQFVRSAFRLGNAPAARNDDIGFRCARVQE